MIMDPARQIEELDAALLHLCSESTDSFDAEELSCLIAKRMVLLNEMRETVLLHPSAGLVKDLDREVTSGHDLIERLHCARTELSDDLTGLERLRISPGGGVDAVG